MDKYLNDVTKIVKFYYITFTLAISNFSIIILMIFLGLFSLVIPLIIFGFIFIIFTILLIKMYFDAKKHVKMMDSYYTIYFDKKYGYDDIVSLIESNNFIEDTYKYTKRGVLFLFVKKIICRILFLDMDIFDKKEYDKIKIKINKDYNKKINYHTGSCGRTLVSKKLRVNIIYLNKEDDNIYKYISSGIANNFRKTEGTLNIAIIGNKMIIPSINDGSIWMEYSVIKYKIVLDWLFKIFNIVCCKF